MFANLIASSLTEQKKGTTHPAYIEIIKQLQSDEALILKFMVQQESHRKGHAPTIDIIVESAGTVFSFKKITSEFNLIAEDAGCLYPENFWGYFANLKRIGLIEHSSGTCFSQDQHKRIFDSPKAKEVYESEQAQGHKATWKFGTYNFTRFGNEFAKVVIST